MRNSASYLFATETQLREDDPTSHAAHHHKLCPGHGQVSGGHHPPRPRRRPPDQPLGRARLQADAERHQHRRHERRVPRPPTAAHAHPV